MNDRRPSVNGMLRFDGRVIAITGAHHGLGRSHALLLASRGARLIVNDINGAAETVDLVVAAGGSAIEDTSDITSSDGTDALVEAALDQWGRLDAIVNNAAGGASVTLPDEGGAHATLDSPPHGPNSMVCSTDPQAFMLLA